VLFAMSLPATVSYVAFMKVESSSYLKIRLDILFSVYVVFVVAVIVRYAWAAWTALRGQAAAEVDVTQKGYGL
jgi:C4-dicarboxylate transporter, DctQ subunit